MKAGKVDHGLPLCKFFLADYGIYKDHQNRFTDEHPHRAINRRLYVPYSKTAKVDSAVNRVSLIVQLVSKIAEILMISML
jgi:hypothetical protein